VGAGGGVRAVATDIRLAARRLSLGAPVHAARLATVDLPLLLVGVEHDRLVSAAAIRRVARALPRAELTMFDEGAHEILREQDGPRLAAFARIDTFLDKHAA
jgi:lysophospholipase